MNTTTITGGALTTHTLRAAHQIHSAWIAPSPRPRLSPKHRAN